MDILPFIIGGLTTGSVYGLAGVGLVLTYKTSGIFNFAFGSLATVSAFLFYTLHTQHHMPWPLAAFLTVFVAGPAEGLLLELMGRVFVKSGLVTRVVGTLGLVLIVQAAVVLIYGTTETRTVEQYLPASSFHLGRTVVAASDLIVCGITLLATVGLYVYFRAGRGGVAMRGVVDDPDLLALAGTNPTAVRRRAWVISVTFASLSGVLIAPLLAQIDGTTLTLLVVTAFGAAAIGSFASIPLTYAGGLLIGVASSAATKYFSTGILADLPAALPFVVLFLVLLASPRARLVVRGGGQLERVAGLRAPMRVQAAGGVITLALLLAAPTFAGIHLADWTSFAANITLFLSLGLLVRTSGQVSLCHSAFLAIGASAFSHFMAGHGLPWLVALMLAGLVAVPVGAVLSFPAIRLSGLYLALASLGFGIVASYMFYPQDYMFGSLGLGRTIPRPQWNWVDVSSDRGYYYFVLLFAVLTTLLLVLLNRSRLGRLLSALSTSPTGLTTSGAAVNVTRVLVFCISAFLAAVSGVLNGGVNGIVTGDQYGPLLSLTYFVLVVIAWGGDPWYAVMAAAGISLVPSYVTGTNVTNYLTLAFGISAVIYAITPTQRGLPVGVRALLDRVPGRTGAAQPAVRAPGTPALRAVAAQPTVVEGLTVSGLVVRFGGVVAVNDVSFEAPAGRVTGLIGPNGAGKTTTFNACSGLVRQARGDVHLGGSSVIHRGAASRARLGIGRTFQRMELFDNMTVQQNVRLGHEARYAGANPLTHLGSTRQQEDATRKAALESLQLCSIEHLADMPVSALSTGQRRVVELARCLAGSYSVLLLDEPSSGLDRFETERFGEILRRAVSERGVGILLVEHDLALVTSICDHLYVLDFGKLIFSGSPSEAMASPLVRAAYLGDALPGTTELAGSERDT